MTSMSFDLVVIGGGPAGLTAAMYAARMGMQTVLFERGLLGGRAIEAPIVENFPGFPEGINGIDLMERMIKQAQKFGVDFKYPEEVLELSVDKPLKILATRHAQYTSQSIIIATGTQRKKLAVNGETTFLGRGVSYCPLCDGPLFKDKITAVIGSGNEALEDALHLSTLSKKVYVIMGKEEEKAAERLINQCIRKENIEIVKAEVQAIRGDNYVKSVEISNLDNNVERELSLDGIFISMGSIPMTNIVLKAGIIVDGRGCIKVGRRQETNIEGVFAAGDCTCGGMQIVTAMGEGATAAIQAYRYEKQTA